MLMTHSSVDVASVACENTYVKMPKPSVNRRGKPCTKMKYTRVAAVVGKRMKSKDTKTATESAQLVNLDESETDDAAAGTKVPTCGSATAMMHHLKYWEHGAHVLFSSRSFQHDV